MPHTLHYALHPALCPAPCTMPCAPHPAMPHSLHYAPHPALCPTSYTMPHTLLYVLHPALCPTPCTIPFHGISHFSALGFGALGFPPPAYTLPPCTLHPTAPYPLPPTFQACNHKRWGAWVQAVWAWSFCRDQGVELGPELLDAFLDVCEAAMHKAISLYDAEQVGRRDVGQGQGSYIFSLVSGFHRGPIFCSCCCCMMPACLLDSLPQFLPGLRVPTLSCLPIIWPAPITPSHHHPYTRMHACLCLPIIWPAPTTPRPIPAYPFSAPTPTRPYLPTPACLSLSPGPPPLPHCPCLPAPCLPQVLGALEDLDLEASTRAYNAMLRACARRGQWQEAKRWAGGKRGGGAPAGGVANISKSVSVS